MKKIDIKIDKISSVQYELYNPKEKEDMLDLSICEVYSNRCRR